MSNDHTHDVQQGRDGGGMFVSQAQLLRRAFHGSTVLVTGHTGFKGSWLSFFLTLLGARVVGLSDREPTNHDHCYFALGISDKVCAETQICGDVRDYGCYERLLRDMSPDYVFHLAAQALVSESYLDPLTTVTTNVVGVANALEVLRQVTARTAAVIVTSDKCYKNKERLRAYREDEEMGGDDPYSGSKGAAELIFHSYRRSFFAGPASSPVSLASARAGNVFGGGDWSSNRLIPDCVKDLRDTGVIRIRMPEAVRPWTFVIDVVHGYMILAARMAESPGEFDGSWNFASGETRTVLDVCKVMTDAYGRGSIQVEPGTRIGKEAGLLLIDAKKASERLSWSPRFAVQESLNHTAEWYRIQADGGQMAEISKNYISEYYL